MAMQTHLGLRELPHRPITALGYCPPRREVLVGFEDGSIQWCDLESGKTSMSSKEHCGMITHFLFWWQPKLVFSSSNDGTVVAWTSGATVLDRVQLGHPIFSIAVNIHRHLLVCGSKGRLSAYPLDERKESGHVIIKTKAIFDHTHTDIVSQVTCQDHRIYSVGYDRKLLIYDTYLNTDKKGLRVVHSSPRAHSAGITHLLLVREQESTRDNYPFLLKCLTAAAGRWVTPSCVSQAKGGVLTGSFDKTVAVWSQDAQLIHRLNHFTGIITGLCYVSSVGTVWIASSNTHPAIYDLRTGEIVSDFVDTFQDAEDRLALQRLLCPNEGAHVIGTTKQHQVFIWKYNAMGCVTILPGRHPVECLSYTPKTPFLLFSGHSNGMVQKWQQSHLSPFLYRSLFVEALDMLVTSSEDGDIYIWEFDDSITGSAPATLPPAHDTHGESENFGVILPKQSVHEALQPEQEKHLMLNKREAGLTCKKLLSRHTHTVSALALVGMESGYNSIYLLSGGWDRRLCLWDLVNCSLKETFSNPDVENWKEMKTVACDGSILDLAYCPDRKLFAYSCSDGKVYIRHFGLVSAEMTLVSTLHGHEADVTAIVWHPWQEAWISGSEDGTIRIWDGDNLQCLRTLNAQGAVTCLSLDQVNGCLIAGIQDTIRVYEPESFLQVQSNVGHKDSIQAIIHVPELKQYVSAAWDGTVRFWNAHDSPPLKP